MGYYLCYLGMFGWGGGVGGVGLVVVGEYKHRGCWTGISGWLMVIDTGCDSGLCGLYRGFDIYGV